MDILTIVLICVILSLLGILLYRGKSGGSAPETIGRENQQLEIELVRAQERVGAANNEIAHLSQDKTTLLNELREEREKLNEALQSLESTRAYLRAQQEKSAEQKAEIEQIRERFTRDFEVLANRILEEKSQKFTDLNSLNLDRILNPLKEKIKHFEEQVEKAYLKESGERNVLQGMISQMMELNNTMSLETQNLTRALKGDNKKQGNWGEMILEKILERSGLVRDQEYRIQASHLSADGQRFQPDVVIDLPDHKHLVIDAKVSLTAYERHINCESEEEREIFLKQHIQSLRNHINELSLKNYSDLNQIHSPDFVMLFIPIESCFSLAVQRDAEIFNYSWDKRVVIVSPSTLLATLRTIASMWKQERQNRNVMEIARLSGEMYDKFVGFINDMETIGKNIRQSQTAYESAMNKLSTGRGNLGITAEKIKKLGARTGKQLDQRFIQE